MVSLINTGERKFVSRDLVNGTFKESFNALATSNGTVVTVTLTNGEDATQPLTMQFSTGDFLLAAGSTVTMTPGSDVSPTANYVYVPISTKALTNSTAWPNEEHIKVSYFLTPSATYVQSDGTYINQNWNDHLKGTDGMGHLAHMAERSRRDGAYYFSGIDGNGTDGYLTPTAGNVELKCTSGIIYQMHKHTVSAFDTSTGDTVLIKNWFGDAFHGITNLYDIVADSGGNTIGNNKWFNLVTWGVANKTGEFAPMMINLPSGFYNAQSSAENDVDGHDDFTLPRNYNKESSTGFLVSRITIQMKTGGGTWVVGSTTDLRGLTPTTASGGSAGVTTSFADNQFEIFNVADITKIWDFDSSSIGSGQTRTLTMANEDMDLAEVPLTTGARDFTNTQGFSNIGGDGCVIRIGRDTEIETINICYDNVTPSAALTFEKASSPTAGTFGINVDSNELTVVGTGWELFPSTTAQLALGKTTNVINALYMGDSHKIFQGAQQDFEIFHDGNDAFLTCNTGDIKLSAAGGDIDFADDNLTSTGTLNIGAITATSYDGVLAVNLLDKTATESLTGVYTWTSNGIKLNDDLDATFGTDSDCTMQWDTNNGQLLVTTTLAGGASAEADVTQAKFVAPIRVAAGVTNQTDWTASLFGPSISADVNITVNRRDSLVSNVITSRNQSVHRAGLFVVELASDTGATSGAKYGLNAFAYTNSTITGALNNTNPGGLIGGRYGARHQASGTVDLGVGVSSEVIIAGGDQDGTYTDAADFVAEDISTGTGGTITRAYGFLARNHTNAGGTLGTAYGLYVEAQTAATNNYGIYIAGGGTYAIWSDAGLNRFDGDGTDVFELPADATDPTGGGAAADGRIPVSIGGVTKYIAYYDA